jgi:sulfate transport system substrate-binding protein
VDGLEVEGANDPSDPFPAPGTLLTIDGDFGGWADANTTFFDEDDGILTQVQAEAGQ